MGIGAKSIQGFIWRTFKLSMKTCYFVVNKYPILSILSTSFFLLYMFLPSAFIFFVCSLPVFALAVVVYRLYFRVDYKGIEDVKSYKKNDDKPPVVKNNDMGYDVSVLGHGPTTRRRNANERDTENYMQTRIEDKGIVCPTGSNDKLVDKTAVTEENQKEIREVKVDSVNERAESSSPSAMPIVASPPFTSGCIEEPHHFSGYKGETEGESSEDSEEEEEEEEEEEAREDTHKPVEWSADDQKNLMHLGNSETERNERLEHLIARRSARKLLDKQVRNTLMRPATNNSRDPIPSITITTNNPYLDSSDISSIPGSAPSVLLPMHSPFGIPYDPQQEKPNLTLYNFNKEFLADKQKDTMFCRHESFSVGAFSPVEATQGQTFPGFSFKHVPSQLSETSRIENQSDPKDVDKERKTSRENEAHINDIKVADHTIQEHQTSERVFDLVDSHHEEDGNEVQTKQILHENRDNGSRSSTSSEENVPLSGANKAELLRSLSSLARREADAGRYDDDRSNDASYSSDQLLFEKTKNNCFFGDKEMHHAPSNSLASDMQVEISEVSSPQSTSSDEKSLIYEDRNNKEITSGAEDLWPVSVPLSRVDVNESKSRAVNEVSEKDIIDVGFSRIDDLDLDTSDSRSEKVIEQDNVIPNSKPSVLGENTQSHITDFKTEHPGVSDSTNAPFAQNSEYSTKQAEAQTSPEQLKETTPQEVNIVNESLMHDNDGKESLNSSKVIEPVAVAEVSIPTGKTNNKSSEDIPADKTNNNSLEDTDGTLNKHADLDPSKETTQKNDSSLPIYDEDDPSASQDMRSQEGITNFHDNKPETIQNEAKQISESVRDAEGEAELSVKHVDALGPSNPSNSKAIEATDENSSKIDVDYSAVGPSKDTEEIKNLLADEKTEKLQEAKPDKVINQLMTDDAKDDSATIKLIDGESRTSTPNEAVLFPEQTHLNDEVSNSTSHIEVKEPPDPSSEISTNEGSNVINEPLVGSVEDKEIISAGETT